MTNGHRARPALGLLLFYTVAVLVGGYFSFAAVQGGLGLFQRIEAEAEIALLRSQRDRLAAELAEMENLTRRLSDNFLDLDLLDERARDVLGLMRADEIVVR